MATSALVKLEREKRKTDREKWTRDLLRESVLTPNMLRVAMLIAIIAYSTMEARTENIGPVRTSVALALPGIGIPMIAADAGIKDKYALAAISGAAMSYVAAQSIAGYLEKANTGSNIWNSFMALVKDPFGGLWD